MAVSKQESIESLKKRRDELLQTVEMCKAALANGGGEFAQTSLDEAEAMLKELDTNIKLLEDKREKEVKKTNWSNERTLVDAAITKNFIGYLINEDKFVYCKNFGAEQSNVQFNLVPSTRVVRLLNKMIGQPIYGKDTNEMVDYFQVKGYSYYNMTSSFNQRKWNEKEVYNKMSVIRQSWLKPNYTEAHMYDKSFDLLMETVGGGKQENIDHLEQWVAYKFLHPERNANTPNLDLGGNPGGNGKGRFVEIMKTIFTPTCVVQAHKEELEKFNANWEMAVILYYDEPEEKELSAAKLKQKTGEEDMRIEKKGIDATMADRNYNFIFISNNEMGVVKLSGGSSGSEDRRYSVINTDMVMRDVLLSGKMTTVQADAFLDEFAQKTIKDPVEVGRWLAHIIQKHNIKNMPHLPALHGDDYNQRFETQKDEMTLTFDKLLPVFQQQKFVPQTVLGDIVRIDAGNSKLRDLEIMRKFQTYLNRKKVDAEIEERYVWNTVWNGQAQNQTNHQSKVIRIKGVKPRDLEYNQIYKKNPNAGVMGVPRVLHPEDLVI